MKHIHKNLAIVLATLWAASGAAIAQTATGPGWYLGGSIGAATLKPKIDNSNTNLTGAQDTRDTGFKFLGGYQFDANWAVEGQYQDLGRWTYSEPGLSASARVSGLSLAGVGMLPLGNGFTLLGKLGVARQTFDIAAVDTTSNASATRKLNKTTPLIGIGTEYTLTPALALRAEYEYFGVPTLAQSGNEKLKAHTALLSVGLRYRF